MTEEKFFLEREGDTEKSFLERLITGTKSPCQPEDIIAVGFGSFHQEVRQPVFFELFLTERGFEESQNPNLISHYENLKESFLPFQSDRRFGNLSSLIDEKGIKKRFESGLSDKYSIRFINWKPKAIDDNKKRIIVGYIKDLSGSVIYI